MSPSPRPFLLPTLAALAIAGCASTSPAYDEVFGDATRGLHAQQTLDPQASRRAPAAPTGTPGRQVREAMNRLGESYKTPPPSSVIHIGVGGGNGP